MRVALFHALIKAGPELGKYLEKRPDPIVACVENPILAAGVIPPFTADV